MKKSIIIIIMIFYTIVSSIVSIAQNGFDYPDFSSIEGLNLVGDAFQSDSTLRLTPAQGDQSGAGWYSLSNQQVDSGFATTFQFQLTDLTNDGADGLAFVIQNSSTASLGWGYIDIVNCVAVELDTWENWDAGDPNDNHISVQTRGSLPNSDDHMYSLGETTDIPDMSDGDVHTAMIDYLPGEMNIFMDNLSEPVLTIEINLSDILFLDNGKAWVGFTARTGGGWENHDILNWAFDLSGKQEIEITPADTLDFGTVFIGHPDTSYIEVRNLGFGTDVLHITDISVSGDGFSAQTDTFSLFYNETHLIPVIFDPLSVQDYSGAITISSDDPLIPVTEIILKGSGAEPPDISVAPDSIGTSLITGASTTEYLTIDNTNGFSDLDWAITIEDRDFPTITFTKEDYTDWTDPANQDRITDNVWLTRDDTRGLFNAATETNYNWGSSPYDTEWAYGLSEDLDPEDYQNWRDAVYPPPSMVGQPLALHLISDDIYFDLMFHSWSAANSGGGFSYTRSALIPDWITISSYSGTTSAGSSEIIEVTIDADGLAAEAYNAYMVINSNDPDEGIIRVPVHLDVSGAPNITTDADSLNFGQVFLNATSSLDLFATNNGTDDLLITSVTADPAEYTITPAFAALNPGEIEPFTITFTPTTVADYPGSLVFTSNDPDSANFVVVLSGQGVEPPIITVSPDSLSDDLFTNETSTQTVTISNLTGASDLYWNIEMENIGLGTVTFSKEDYADWSDPANQDRITDNVRITRDDNRGLFNAATETEYNWDSPHDTEWSYGLTKDLNPEDYQFWRDAIHPPPSMVGRSLSVHLISDDKYFDFMFHSWTSDNNGGGFSYTRSDIDPRWLSLSQESGVIPAGFSSDIEVTFDATGLFGGNYNANIIINSNDPVTPLIDIPVALTVTGVPDIAVNISPYDSTSTIYWNSSGASTTHNFMTSFNAVGDGELTVTIDGNYYSNDEYAEVYIEGDFVGTLNPNFNGAFTQNFTIPESNLNNYLSNGTVSVSVNNSPQVDPWYANDFHTVRLTYSGAGDSLDFGESFVNYKASREILIENKGTDLLEISSIKVDSADFSVSMSSVDIVYGEEDILIVSFLPTAVRSYNGMLSIVSNDPDQGTIEIPLLGVSIAPPVISVTPDSLSAELSAGDTTTQTLTIFNTGGSDLNFSISNTSASYNYAIEFDGLNDGIKIDDNSVLRFGTGDFTIEAWIYPTATTGSIGWNAIITKHSADDGSWLFRIANNSETGYVPKLNFDTEYPMSNYYANSELDLNTWYHVAVKREGTTGTFYLNGLVDGTFTNNKDLYSTSAVYISDQGNVDDERFTGIIDEIRLWNVARTQNEIQTDMNREIESTEPGLVAYWQFNEGSGTTVYDRTAVSNNGSLQGGPAWVFSTAPILTWLSVDPAFGTVPANNQLDMNVIINTADLSGGDYQQSIIINSNDPNEPEVLIPVYLMVTSVEMEDPFAGIPKKYILYQNYPNPFNPVTHIRYGLPKASDVKIDLYNILGQKVVTILEDHKPAGYHTVDFDGSSVATGVYIYRIEADKFQDVRKMVLIK
jgi:hypothetical protein